MHEPQTAQSPFLTGLLCRCPRCGRGRLFQGFLRLVPKCEGCGLDMSFVNSGDGPAVFVIFLVSPIVILLALIFEALVHPAPYVHLLIWIPVTILLCLAFLRPLKATMIALQYRNDAQEGRLQ